MTVSGLSSSDNGGNSKPGWDVFKGQLRLRLGFGTGAGLNGFANDLLDHSAGFGHGDGSVQKGQGQVATAKAQPRGLQNLPKLQARPDHWRGHGMSARGATNGGSLRNGAAAAVNGGSGGNSTGAGSVFRTSGAGPRPRPLVNGATELT